MQLYPHLPLVPPPFLVVCRRVSRGKLTPCLVVVVVVEEEEAVVAEGGYLHQPPPPLQLEVGLPALPTPPTTRGSPPLDRYSRTRWAKYPREENPEDRLRK